MKAGAVFFGLALVVFGVGVAVHLREPIAEWDYVCLEAARQWAHGINQPWIFDHPPLYPALLAAAFRLVGASVVAARLLNIGCLLAAHYQLHVVGTYYVWLRRPEAASHA